MPQLILEFTVSGINYTGLCCSTCITGLVLAVVCRALSLRLVIMLHYCVIYREHNGVWNNSWGPWKQLCLSLWVFAYRLFCAWSSTPPLSILPVIQTQINFSLSTCVFTLMVYWEKHNVELWGERQWQRCRVSADSLLLRASLDSQSLRPCTQLSNCTEIPSAGPLLSCLSSPLFTLHAWLLVRG